MIYNRFQNLLLVIFLSVLSVGAQSQPVEIANGKYKISYSQNTLSISQTGSKAPFLDGIQLISKSGHQPDVRKITHPLWGEGSFMTIVDNSGNKNTIAVYRLLPFVVMQKELMNASAKEIRIAKEQLFEGKINLGTSPEKLKSMSTAGLHPLTRPSGGYVFMAVGNPETREGIICGWLTSERGSGIVFSDYRDGQAYLRARIDYGDLRIAAAQSAKTEILLLGYATDVRKGLEDYGDALARQLNVKLPAQPSVYCTWYHARASDEKKMKENTDFTFERLKQYGFHVLQIDDYWQLGVKENGPRRNFTGVRPDGPYPSGMKPIADYIRSKGFSPGIWYIPFAGSWNDPFWKDKMDLFLKEGKSPDNYIYKMEGLTSATFPKGEAPYEARWGGTCLDLSNPKAIDYVKFIANRLSNEWGYNYFKVDGLWTGTGTPSIYINSEYRDDDLGTQTRFNPAITPIEGYVNGLKAIRESASSDLFLLGCCTPQNMRSFGPALGRVDAMRVGPDNGANPKLLIRGPQFSTRVFFLNKRVWYNDPDPVYVRASFPEEMAKTSVSWASLTGSLHSSSEQYSELPANRLEILTRSLPSHNLKTVRPVDFLENDPATVWLLTDDRDKVRKDVIGLFNWDITKAANIAYPLNRIELPASSQYVGFDFWANRFIPPFSDSISGLLAPGGCRIISIRPVKDYPQVISTSRHLTQGVIDLTSEGWNAKTQTLSGRSEVIGGEVYELRLVVPEGQNSWLAESSEVAIDGKKQTAEIRQEGPSIRIKFTPKSNQKVDWSVRFKKGAVKANEPAAVQLKAETDQELVQVKWNNASSFQYRLIRNGKLLGELSGESFTDYDVQPGKSYTYGIQAKSWNGSWSAISEATVKVPESLAVPNVPALPDVFCTTLATAEPAQLKINQTFSAKPITLNGVPQKNGIGISAPTTLIYNIPEGAKRFVATVGLDETLRDRPTSRLVFTIMGDVLEMGEPAVVLAKSPVLTASRNNVWHFDVELDGRMKQVRLVAEPYGSDEKCNVEWINAGFVKPVKRATTQGEPGARLNYTPGKAPKSWAVATAETVMARYPDYRKAYWKDWSYVQGYMFFGFEKLYKQTGDKKYLDFMKQYIDYFVDAEGNYIGEELKNLDNLLTGSTIVALYKLTGDERYRKAAQQFRKRFDTYPRSEGQFWHSQGTPNMWVDGIFMGQMFLLKYGQEIGDAPYSYDEAARQITTFARKCRKGDSGLYFHAWTATPEKMVWADPKTGISPEVWSEGLGWYSLVIPELLAVMPKDHPQRAEVLKIYLDMIQALKSTQDAATGGWFLIVDKGNQAGNWIDPSGTAMFVYSIQRGIELGLFHKKEFSSVAKRGYDCLLTYAKVNENGLVDIHGAADGFTIRKSFEEYVSYKPKVLNAKEAVAGFLWAAIIMEGKNIK